jgi:hypothetical protein
MVHSSRVGLLRIEFLRTLRNNVTKTTFYYKDSQLSCALETHISSKPVFLTIFFRGLSFHVIPYISLRFKPVNYPCNRHRCRNTCHCLSSNKKLIYLYKTFMISLFVISVNSEVAAIYKHWQSKHSFHLLHIPHLLWFFICLRNESVAEVMNCVETTLHTHKFRC